MLFMLSQGCLFFNFIVAVGGGGGSIGAGIENWGFGAILGKKLTVSGLNMTRNAFYPLNKV